MTYDSLMARDFHIIIEKGEDGYLISEVIELPGCHTQAKTKKDLMKRTKEAIRLCLKEQKEPVKPRDSFIGVQKIAV
jgi:predicted RNase H-like HicB family nuclease